MDGYKRNQALEAISITLDEGRSPSLALHTDVRRLLETDRAFGATAREKFAFFTGEAPGRGAEVYFSAYEVFALRKALDLLHHGWPQATAVKIMRQVRPALEPKHKEIMKLGAAKLFDEKRMDEISEGCHVTASSACSLYLVIASRKGRPADQSSDDTREVVIVEHDELMPFLVREAGISSTVMELSRLAYDLQAALEKTTPSKRGRGA